MSDSEQNDKRSKSASVLPLHSLLIRALGAGVALVAVFHWVHLWQSAVDARIDEAAIPRLLRLLESNDSRESDRALKGLKELGERAVAAVPKLSEQLQLGNPRAAIALGHIGASGIPALVSALDITNRVVRPMTLGERVFGSGRHGLRDRNYRERIPQHAMNALIALKAVARPAVPVLITLANDPRRDAGSRQHAVATLGAIGAEPASVVPILLPALHSGDSNMVRAAAHAVRAFSSATNQTVPALLMVLRTNAIGAVQRDAGDSLVALGATSQVTSILLQRLDGWDGETRAWAAETLGRTCQEPVIAVPALAGLSADTNQTVRVAAVGALGGYCPRSSHAVLQCLRALHDGSPAVVQAAMDGLGGEAARWGETVDHKAECAMRRMGSFRDWKHELTELRHAPDPRARRFAAWLLESFAPPQ